MSDVCFLLSQHRAPSLVCICSHIINHGCHEGLVRQHVEKKANPFPPNTVSNGHLHTSTAEITPVSSRRSARSQSTTCSLDFTRSDSSVFWVLDVEHPGSSQQSEARTARHRYDGSCQRLYGASFITSKTARRSFSTSNECVAYERREMTFRANPRRLPAWAV